MGGIYSRFAESQNDFRLPSVICEREYETSRAANERVPNQPTRIRFGAGSLSP
jgi:hypothetical protein